MKATRKLEFRQAASMKTLRRRHPVKRPAFALRAAALCLIPFVFIAGQRFIAAAIKTPQLISVAEARALPAGAEAIVEGVITSPPGAFKSSKLDDGFTLEDDSGGIYVSLKGRSNWRIGERVRVAGKLADSNGQLVIVIDGRLAMSLGRGDIVRPQAVATGAVNEATESRLVKVTGRITRPVFDDPPYGFRLYIDDGTGETIIYVSATTKIGQRGLLRGARVSVTGIGGQYQKHYEVEPRFPADLRLLPPDK